MKMERMIALLGICLVGMLLIFPERCPGAEFNVHNVSELESALNQAAVNDQADTINISPGMYIISSTLSYAPDVSENFPLIITGSGSSQTWLDGGSGYPVLSVIAWGSDADFTLQNLTVQNGNSAGCGGGAAIDLDSADARVENCLFQNCLAVDNGGGVFVSVNSGTITLRNNTLLRNETGNDGAGASLYAYSGSILAELNTFNANTTRTQGGDDGGGLSAMSDAGSILIQWNTFMDNVAADDGGGLFTYHLENGALTTVRNNTFHRNVADLGGGGAFCRSTMSATINILDNRFEDNVSDASGGGVFLYLNSGTSQVSHNAFYWNSSVNVEPDGGGLWAWTHDGQITAAENWFVGNEASRFGGGASLSTDSGTVLSINNNYVGNRAVEYGGAVSWATDSGGLSMINDTLYVNTAVEGAGILYYCEQASNVLVVINSIFWGNDPDNILATGAAPVMAQYSNIEAGIGESWFGPGCIDGDPLFVNPPIDLRLDAGSPCIDAADGGPAPEFDWEGQPRWDDPATSNTGNGPPWVDIGADEYNPGAPTVTPTPSSPPGTPTPTPPAGITIAFDMGTHVFQQGDSCYLDLGYSNSYADRAVDLVILMDVYGQFLSYPGWNEITEELTWTALDIMAGAWETLSVIPAFTMPTVSSAGPFYFYGLMFDRGYLDVNHMASNLADWEFYLQ